MSATKQKTPPIELVAPAEVLAEMIASPRVIELRAPTPDQRAAIRGLLEKHFDDGEGAYADGQSDQTIAEAVNVPRLVVEQIREVGYGSIRVNPELVALLREVKAARADLTGLMSMMGDVESRIAGLEGRTKALRGTA